MAEAPRDPELVDINHPYMQHPEKDFTWGFDKEKALMWAGAVVGSVIDHTMHGGPEHALDLMAVQAGMLQTAAPEGTQLPVLMMRHTREDGTTGYAPVAVLLVGDDRILDLAHTLGSLVDDDGVHPALPSRMADTFYEPPVEVDDSIDPITGMPKKVPPTTVFDLLDSRLEAERNERTQQPGSEDDEDFDPKPEFFG